MAVIIRGGTVVNADRSFRADVVCDGGKIVEGRHTVMVDTLIWAHRDARRDVADGARHGGHDDVVQHRDDLVTRDNQHWSSLLIGRLHQPQLALSYQGSASVSAMALAIANSSSSGVCAHWR